MKISRGWKIVIGILTVIIAVFPFMVGPLMMLFMVYNPSFATLFDPTAMQSPEAILRWMRPLLLFEVPLMCWIPLQLATQIFYVAHVLKNKELTDSLRLLFALAVFFMPMIGMPIYFVVYVWKDAVPPADSDKPAVAL